MTKVLITGGNGQLGQKIIEYLIEYKSNEYDIISTSTGKECLSIYNSNIKYYELNICDADEIENIFSKEKPNIVINCAAMTNVDACEIEKDKCYEINTFSVEKLIKKSIEIQAHFIHISTDFIFDGEKDIYSEDDIPNPLSIYGKSKLDSEKILINTGYPKITIARTIVVWGFANKLNKSNIVLWVKNMLKDNQEIKIVGDQVRSLTFAQDLAKACIQIAERKAFGIFNVSGSESYSMYDLAIQIAKFYNFNTNKISKISTKELNQKAIRPPKTIFNINKAQHYFDYKPLTLSENLIKMEKELLKYN